MTAFIDAAPGAPFLLSGTVPGFDPLHGIPVAAIGDDADRLLALGHLTDRAVLAVTNAYHRRILGESIAPTNELTDLIAFGTHRVHVYAVRAETDDDCGWYLDDADPHHPFAQAATVIHNEWLEREDIENPSACPACTRISRSVRWCPGPDRTGWAFFHRCRYCAHRWLPPAAAHPDPRPALPRPRAAAHDLEAPSCTRSA